ncbi:hypothetical protein lbkm_3350 [Lachnospiraceae bacterium KM106-2]|nr:hypothetical protein lbkm_3350 [Lachnospiraceae bacterium KM106-2]
MNINELTSHQWYRLESSQRKHLIYGMLGRIISILLATSPFAFGIGLILSIICGITSGFNLQLIFIPFLPILVVVAILLFFALIMFLFYCHISYFYVSTVIENKPDRRVSANPAVNENYNEATFLCDDSLVWKRYDILDCGVYHSGDTLIFLSSKRKFHRHGSSLIKPELLFFTKS